MVFTNQCYVLIHFVEIVPGYFIRKTLDRISPLDDIDQAKFFRPHILPANLIKRHLEWRVSSLLGELNPLAVETMLIIRASFFQESKR